MLSSFFLYIFCRLLTFFKKKNQNAIRVSNGLDPFGQDRQSVGTDLDPNFFQRLSADDKRRR